jgi:hypothetical protein
MDTYHIHVSINLDALLGELQQALQLTINLVAVALQAKLSKGEELRLPRGVIATTFASNLAWTTEEASEHHKIWALSNGLRDTVEGLSNFLESAHHVLSTWALADCQNEDGCLKASAWDEEIINGGKAFHRLGFPDKLSHITASHGVTLDETLARQVVSINTARNCLVHRGGVVGERDKNDERGLTVEWRKLSMFLQDEDGEYDFVIGGVTRKESWLCMRSVDYRKSFNIGERISFTTQEFADITWGFFVFGSDLVQRIGRVGVSKGFVTPSAETAQQVNKPDRK